MIIVFDDLDDGDPSVAPHVVARKNTERFYARPDIAELLLLEDPPRDPSRFGNGWELLRCHLGLVQRIMEERIEAGHAAGEILISRADLFRYRG